MLICCEFHIIYRIIKKPFFHAIHDFLATGPFIVGGCSMGSASVLITGQRGHIISEMQIGGYLQQ